MKEEQINKLAKKKLMVYDIIHLTIAHESLGELEKPVKTLSPAARVLTAFLVFPNFHRFSITP